MKRSNIVAEIMNNLNDDDIVIAATGYISREVFKYDRPLNFYMMGSMGCALSIGIGLALNVKQRVLVINGDGGALMGLGSMVTAQSLKIKNLYHFILDNQCHESTGGQETSSRFLDFRNLCRNTLVYKIGKDDSQPPRITLKTKEITERFRDAVCALSNE